MTDGATPLTQAERVARLQLAWTPGIGPVTFRGLLSRFGSASEALAALPQYSKTRKKPFTPPEIGKIEATFSAMETMNGHILLMGDTDYPAYLMSAEDAPPALLARGRVELAAKPAVAFVGARNASAAGQKLAGTLACGIGQAGYVVASGLARGIDTAAHNASLETGTVAVLGGGPDVIYPKENTTLQDRIAAEGLILTEHAPGTEPVAKHFPRRNRIISGLSIGVVVVEAAVRSGSLITARMAGEQGRYIMAVPGNPTDARAAGTNHLIREGATLVTSTEDILDVVGTLNGGMREPGEDFWTGADGPKETPEDDHIEDIRTLLSSSPVALDDLVRHAHLPAHAVSMIILELEMRGEIERHPGGKISLI